MVEYTLPYTDFARLLHHIREIILSARSLVARSVDTVQVSMNYAIGQRIVEHEQQGEQRAAYGKKVLPILTEALTAEFGRGFSVTNLSLCASFTWCTLHKLASHCATFFSPSQSVRQPLANLHRNQTPLPLPTSVQIAPTKSTSVTLFYGAPLGLRQKELFDRINMASCQPDRFWVWYLAKLIPSSLTIPFICITFVTQFITRGLSWPIFKYASMKA